MSPLRSKLPSSVQKKAQSSAATCSASPESQALAALPRSVGVELVGGHVDAVDREQLGVELSAEDARLAVAGRARDRAAPERAVDVDRAARDDLGAGSDRAQIVTSPWNDTLCPERTGCSTMSEVAEPPAASGAVMSPAARPPTGMARRAFGPSRNFGSQPSTPMTRTPRASSSPSSAAIIRGDSFISETSSTTGRSPKKPGERAASPSSSASQSAVGCSGLSTSAMKERPLKRMGFRFAGASVGASTASGTIWRAAGDKAATRALGLRNRCAEVRAGVVNGALRGGRFCRVGEGRARMTAPDPKQTSTVSTADSHHGFCQNSPPE